VRWWPALTTTLLLSACATQTSTRVVAAAAPPPLSRAPEADLSSAFDEAPPPTATGPKVTPPPPLPDLRAPLREALEAISQALANHDLAGAEASLSRATQLAGTLGLVERLQVAKAGVMVAVKRGDGAQAASRARSWLHLCGGGALQRCRSEALAALLATTRLRLEKPQAVRAEVKRLQRAEECLKKAERLHTLDRCLADVEQLARTSADALLATRAAYVRALAAPEKQQVALLKAVERQCQTPSCVTVRRQALAALMARATAQGKTDEAARWALADATLFASTLPEAERLWGRPAETDVACAAYDAATGPLACRRLEKQLTGTWAFRDFSKDAPTDGLTPHQVRAVNEHYAVLLQACLEAQARRLTPPDAVRYELRWVVFNDGRVGEVHFTKPSLDDSELGRCLKAQFETWRYPRSDGQWQHVEQAFTITAVERRSHEAGR